MVSSASDPVSDVAVGRCMQRAWLALTRRGMVAQPMSTIPAFEAMLEPQDGGAGVTLAERDRAAALVASFRAAFPSVERGARIGMLLRFGWASAPTSVVRRLPLEESVALAQDAPAPP